VLELELADSKDTDGNGSLNQPFPARCFKGQEDFRRIVQKTILFRAFIQLQLATSIAIA